LTSEEDALEALRVGLDNYVVRKTKRLEASQDSHTIFSIKLRQRFRDNSEYHAKISLFDLSGFTEVRKNKTTKNFFLKYTRWLNSN
jgi:hypothetical protein